MCFTDDVQAARCGDRAAFARLVARFQAMAIAHAVSWAGDQAEDVAQDAFIDAFLHLGQLREPAAFPAWLRMIVRKHCDRCTRRQRPFPLGAGLESASRPFGSESLPELALDRAWLRSAIATLPEHERVVVALHYLAGESQAEIAQLLELTPSAVKKRLYSARTRLRAREEDMSHTTQPTVLADRIGLFLAIRAGDVAGASGILDRRPELLDAEERWSVREALDGGLPVAHRVPPLVLAASHGDLPMVRMLLDRGAALEAACGCADRETALWTATRSGYTEVAAALLSAGADPEAKNRAGYRPAEAARLLANERVRVSGGRIETGIKAIDLLAPLELGQRVRVHGQAGTGLMALVAELSARFGDAVWWTTMRELWQKNELLAFAADCGIRPDMGGDFAGRTLFLFGDEAQRAELEALLPRLGAARISFVIDPWAEATRGGRVPELAPPFDALIATDPELARAGVFPAIDRRVSRSRAGQSERHAALAEQIRMADQSRILPFFQQWFGVWQHRSGQAGEDLTLAQTLDAAEACLVGSQSALAEPAERA